MQLNLAASLAGMGQAGVGQAGPLSPDQMIDYQACMWQCQDTATEAECSSFCYPTALSMPSTVMPAPSVQTTVAKQAAAQKAAGQLIPGVSNYWLLAGGVGLIVLLAARG